MPENTRSDFHKLSYANEDDPLVKRLVINLIEVLSGRPKIQKLYEEVQQMSFEGYEAWTIALEKLSITCDANLEQLTLLPTKGPVIVIANHPFGVVDGLLLGHLTAKIRQKFSILVNHVLCNHEARINEFLLPINFEETKEAQMMNIETKRIASEKLSQGEALIIFPAGGVATANSAFGKAEDLEWKRFVAKLIQKTNATVLPIYVHGRNSRLFQIASHMNTSFRLGLLLNEVRNKMGKKIKLTIGEPLNQDKLKAFKKKQDLIDFLRKETFQHQPK